MKIIPFVVVTLTLIVISSADEDKKTKILNLWSCIACHENAVAREEYMKCVELKPEKCKQMSVDCKTEIMPELDTSDKRWSIAFCKGEHDEPSRYYDCLMSHKLRKELNEDEKTELKEFLQCIKKVGSKFC